MTFLNFLWVMLEFEMYKTESGTDTGSAEIYIDTYLITLYNNFILIFDF